MQTQDFDEDYSEMLKKGFEELNAKHNTDVDKTILIILGALFAVYFIPKSPTNDLTDLYRVFKVFIMVTISLNVITFLAFLRYTVRMPKKITLFRNRYTLKFNEGINEFRKDFYEFAMDFLTPSLLSDIGQTDIKNSPEIKKKLKEKIESLFNDNKIIKKVMLAYTNDLYNQLQSKEMLFLDEKFPKLNYTIDSISSKTRYPMLVLFFTLLFITLTLYLNLH